MKITMEVEKCTREELELLERYLMSRRLDLDMADGKTKPEIDTEMKKREEVNFVYSTIMRACKKDIDTIKLEELRKQCEDSLKFSTFDEIIKYLENRTEIMITEHGVCLL